MANVKRLEKNFRAAIGTRDFPLTAEDLGRIITKSHGTYTVLGLDPKRWDSVALHFHGADKVEYVHAGVARRWIDETN